MSKSIAELRTIAHDACLACGASEAVAQSLVEAILAAACCGRPEVGFPHLLDYLHSFREGRIDGKATPQFSYPLPAIIHADARDGIAQLGFDLAFDDFAERVNTYGIALFAQNNSYTSGELGYYVRRLAYAGLISIATSNANAVMATAPGGKQAFSTNPLAFAAPARWPRPPLVIDQASSATAFVNIARAAARNEPIPEGWATDASGIATTDASKALVGSLLPFGGYKGANIAMMVEVLSAGLSGANWSLEAGNFRSGDRPPGVGLTIVAISQAAAKGPILERLSGHLEELEIAGVHIPGKASAESFQDRDALDVDDDVIEEMLRLTA